MRGLLESIKSEKFTPMQTTRIKDSLVEAENLTRDSKRILGPVTKSIENDLDKGVISAYSAKNLGEALEKLPEDKYRDRIMKRLNPVIKNVEVDLDKYHIPVKTVWNYAKAYNRIPKGPTHSDSLRMLFPTKNALESALDNYGIKNKTFGYAHKNANILHAMDKGLPIIDQIVNKVTGMKDTGISAYARNHFTFSKGGFTGLLGKNILSGGIKRGQTYYKSHAFRQHVNNLAKGTIKNSLPMAMNAVRGLSKTPEDKFELILPEAKKAPVKRNNPDDFELILPK